MKNEQQKQIEERTGEILRQYTTFEGHLKNFIQQYHHYDLLLICKKIYQIKQQLHTYNKIDWDNYKHSILFLTKDKQYRKEQINYPDDYPESEPIDFKKLYDECWYIISKPFVLQQNEHDLLMKCFLTHNITDEEIVCRKPFNRIFDKIITKDICCFLKDSLITQGLYS